MIQKVLSFAGQHHMIERGSHILAAVSGGADSVCLLLVLKELAGEYGFRLTAAHIEHGIRGEASRRDAAFVQRLCRVQEVPCLVYSCDAPAYAKEHRMSLEEGARQLRYDRLAQAAAAVGADKIAVAHHQNDCAETLLFHLARGSGLKGFCAILPVRDNLIRPLLAVSREEIEAFLAERRQEYCTDETNLEIEYSRNKIRRQVLPVLTEINQQAVAHLYRSTELFAQVNELVEELAARARARCVEIPQTPGVVLTDRILSESLLIQETVVFGLLKELAGSGKNLTSVHVRQTLELFARQTGRRVSLPYGLTAVRTYAGVWLCRAAVPKQAEEFCRASEPLYPGEELWLKYYNFTVKSRIFDKNRQFDKIPQKKYTKWFDYDKIKNTLLLRGRCPGDYFVIDASGRRQKLKKYLINEKIPREEREDLLLLAEQNHVLWAVGYRISDAYKVTGDTKRILEVQVNGGRIHE